MTYRSEKAVQEQKIGQLLQENEAIEKRNGRAFQNWKRRFGESLVKAQCSLHVPGSTAVSILDKADLRRLK